MNRNLLMAKDNYWKVGNEYRTADYCVLPRFITKKNMFDGTQYYSATEHILGIKPADSKWVNRRVYSYDNPIFKGVIAYESNVIYGSIVVYIKIKDKEYYSCNGLCEPERSTQILELYKKVKEYCGKEYFGQYDIEEYMFVELQKLSVKKFEINS